MADNRASHQVGHYTQSPREREAPRLLYLVTNLRACGAFSSDCRRLSPEASL